MTHSPADMLDFLRIRQLPRAFAALVMLTALLFGSVGHAVHHFVDRDCESGSGAQTGPCSACAGLHAAQLPGDLDPAALPRPVVLDVIGVTQFAEPAPAPPCATSARAPPSA